MKITAKKILAEQNVNEILYAFKNIILEGEDYIDAILQGNRNVAEELRKRFQWMASNIQALESSVNYAPPEWAVGK